VDVFELGLIHFIETEWRIWVHTASFGVHTLWRTDNLRVTSTVSESTTVGAPAAPVPGSFSSMRACGARRAHAGAAGGRRAGRTGGRGAGPGPTRAGMSTRKTHPWNRKCLYNN